MRTLLYGMVCLGCFITTIANAQPIMRQQDKIRIREAIHISKQAGNKIWPRFHDVPFTVLLVTDSLEFLLNHPNPSNDFTFSEYDPLLNAEIHYRKKIFDKHLLATFPAVNGVPCIVIGLPENTNLNSTEWVITLLHEHFHQYQNFQTDYYQSVNKLDLAGGDETGMWMLNYPFPYDSLPVQVLYKKYTQALDRAVRNMDNKKFSSSFKRYKALRQRFKNILSEKDYRYFSFQLWQEGLSRFTEYLFLSELKHYNPSDAFRTLAGFENFEQYRKRMKEREIKNLTSLSLNSSRRVSFYSLGFAEGLLLQKINPHWQKNYFSQKFYLERYFEKASVN